MKRPVVIAFVILMVLFCFSCKEKSANPENRGPVSSSFQSSKCMGSALSKRSSSDSVFTYTFADALIVDFSVTGNCCPDSDRYSVSSLAGSDTIVIAAIDTAEHLCRCLCRYMIHSEFLNLPNDHYIVKCTIAVPQGEPERIHQVDVHRHY
jgi:hypothetical protein